MLLRTDFAGNSLSTGRSNDTSGLAGGSGAYARCLGFRRWAVRIAGPFTSPPSTSPPLISLFCILFLAAPPYDRIRRMPPRASAADVPMRRSRSAVVAAAPPPPPVPNLPEVTLDRGLHAIGSPRAIHPLFSQLHAGEPIVIGVLGASVGQNAGCLDQGRKRCMMFKEDKKYPHSQHLYVAVGDQLLSTKTNGVS